MAFGFLIDMDGVIYGGEDLIPGAPEFIETLKREKIPFLFLTNNSQRTKRDVVVRLEKMGIEVDASHVFTSAMATARFLATQKPNGTAYVLGEGGLISSLHVNGYSMVQDKPDYVVVGEGRNFTLEMVQDAVDLLLDGAKLIATNLDPPPRKKGWANLGIAAIVKMLEVASGKQAFTVGKPSPVMMRAARKELGMQTAETIIIGDTMDTDIQGGVQMGYKTILVLSGVSKREEMNNYAFCPHMIVDSIADLNLEDLKERFKLTA